MKALKTDGKKFVEKACIGPELQKEGGFNQATGMEVLVLVDEFSSRLLSFEVDENRKKTKQVTFTLFHLKQLRIIAVLPSLKKENEGKLTGS